MASSKSVVVFLYTLLLIFFFFFFFVIILSLLDCYFCYLIQCFLQALRKICKAGFCKFYFSWNKLGMWELVVLFLRNTLLIEATKVNFPTPFYHLYLFFLKYISLSLRLAWQLLLDFYGLAEIKTSIFFLNWARVSHNFPLYTAVFLFINSFIFVDEPDKRIKWLIF